MHHSRHKEILRIIREVEALDEPGSFLPPGKPANGKPRRGSSTTNTTSSNTFTDTASEPVSVDETKVTRRQRKKAKKASNGYARDRKSFEAFPKEETDFVSEAIHLSVHESKGAWHGTYIYEHHRKSVVEEGAVIDGFAEETLVPQFESFAVKTPGASVKDCHTQLKELTPRQRKTVLKLTTSVKHSNKGGNTRKFSTQFITEMADPFNGLDPQIFFRLGVEVDPPKSSRARKELITKLMVAVKEDIDIIEREDAETNRRAEGFRRWAGRAAYATILETRLYLDWATGQKITVPSFEEFDDDEIDLEAIEEVKNVEDDPISSPTPQDENLSKPKVKSPLASKKTDGEDDGGFTVASRRKAPTKKARGAKKFTKLSSNSISLQTTLNIDEEEEGEDVHEMIRRYEQRQAGERNLGGAYPRSTPCNRTGRGRTLVIK